MLGKPIAEGTGKGVTPRSVVRSPLELATLAHELLRALSATGARRNVLTGARVHRWHRRHRQRVRAVGSIEIVLLRDAEPDVYSYTNKEECESLVEYRHVTRADPLVAQAEGIALDAWIALSCRDGGRVDIRCDARGVPMFLEVNPLAGLHPTHSDLPMIATASACRTPELIRAIIDSAVDPDSRRRASAPQLIRGRNGGAPDRFPCTFCCCTTRCRRRRGPMRRTRWCRRDAVREALRELGHTPEVFAVGDDLGALTRVG